MPPTDPPFASDPLEILLAHDDWATREILKLCRALSPEQFQRSFPIGPGEKGGLAATLTHIIGAKRRWADRIMERTLRPALEATHPDGRGRTVDELAAMLDEAHADLSAAVADARRRGLDTMISLKFGDKDYTFTRGAALTHVLTHGHWHRAQCLNMLRHLGVPGLSDKLPELDVVDWQAAATGQG